jgi:Tfp pilus assembly PilM family ATPase
MVSALLEPLRRAGLEPVGADLSAFGMIRALAGVGAAAPAEDGGAEGDAAAQPAVPAGEEAVLYCNVGDSMNLAVARGRSCLFSRVSIVGLEAIATRLGSERGIGAEHAGEWLAHVGLEGEVDQIQGDPETVAAARLALEEGVGGLTDELRLSLDYYGALESAVPVSRIVLAGPGSAIPGLAERMQTGLGMPISISRPGALGGYDDRTAARLTLPYGIALES